MIPEAGGIQQVGGRITYVRRYVLCALTGVAADEDTDANEDTHARKPRNQNTSPAPPATPIAGQTPTAPDLAESAGEALNPAPAVPASPAPAAGAVPDEPPGSERHRKLVGAVQQHFKRLHYTDSDADRAERLQRSAFLANVATDTVGSLNDLTPEELTTVARELQKCRDRDALTALIVKIDKDRRGDDA